MADSYIILKSVTLSPLSFLTIGNDVWLVAGAEAKVVKGEQCIVPVSCQVRQQFQGSSHLKHTLLAVLRKWEVHQQPQPQAQ